MRVIFKKAAEAFTDDSKTDFTVQLQKASSAGITPDMSESEMCGALKSAMTSLVFDGLTGREMTRLSDGEPSKEPKAVKIVISETPKDDGGTYLSGTYTAM